MESIEKYIGFLSDKLKPCPVCGGEAELGRYNTYVAGFTKADKYYGRCKKNGRHSPQENPVGFMTAKQAVEAWNRRIE